jgi:hypothetical protein
LKKPAHLWIHGYLKLTCQAGFEPETRRTTASKIEKHFGDLEKAKSMLGLREEQLGLTATLSAYSAALMRKIVNGDWDDITFPYAIKKCIFCSAWRLKCSKT